MTDLLTRLREGSSHLGHDATMHEAAAEIERLRAALEAEPAQPEPVALRESAKARAKGPQLELIGGGN
jgi:hypothetical protein